MVSGNSSRRAIRRRGVIRGNGELFFQHHGKSIASMQHMSTLVMKPQINAPIVPAVYHHQIRKELLARAPVGRYREKSGGKLVDGLLG